MKIQRISKLRSDGTVTSYNGETKAIFVPGDNDIGGEAADRVTKGKIERFLKHFPSKPYIHTFSGKSKPKAILEIVQVNLLLQALSGEEKQFYSTSLLAENYPTHEHKDGDDLIFRMLISHLPILPIRRTFSGQNILGQLNPSVIFSAHDHTGRVITVFKEGDREFDANYTTFTQKIKKDMEERGSRTRGERQYENWQNEKSEEFFTIPMSPYKFVPYKIDKEKEKKNDEGED